MSEPQALSPEELAELARIEQLKPKKGCWFLAIPVLAIPLVFGAYAYLLYYGLAGRPAEGQRVRITYDACAEAVPVLAGRLDQMGLPERDVRVVDGQVVVTARLPGDTQVDASVPTTLAMPGRFQVRGDDGTVIIDAPNVESAAPRLNITATPSAAVVLAKPAAQRLKDHMEGEPHGTVSFFLDDERIDGRRNLASLESRDLEVTPHADDPRTNMELAVNWSIVINHGPLPCAVTLRSVDRVGE